MPVKQLTGAKKRLNPHLSEGERTDLSRAMLRDVLDALENTEGLAGTAVITTDESARRMAREAGSALIEDRAGSLNEALALGCRTLATYGAKGVMIVHADLPLADPIAFQSLIDAARSPGVTIAPARADGGTNVMLLCPPDAIALDYGEDSFAKHRLAAEAAGVPVTAVNSPALGLDIDRPEDLKVLIETGPHGATKAYLLESGLAEQLEHLPPD